MTPARERRAGASSRPMALSLAAAIAATVSAVAADEPLGLPEVTKLLERSDAEGLALDAVEAILAESAAGRTAGLDREARQAWLDRAAPLVEAWLAEPLAPSRRLARVDRARRLLATAGSAEGSALRWAIATGGYLAASAAADEVRGAIAGVEDPVGLAARFAALGEELSFLSDDADSSRAAAAAQSLRASGVEADLLAERIAILENRILRGRFLAGWAMVQSALLSGDREVAAAGEAMLLPLLDAGVDEPRPADVSKDRRSDLGFAQTILGLAIAKGIRGDSVDAAEWLAILSDPQVDPDLQAARGAWELLMLVAAGDRLAALGLVESWTRDGSASVAWWRLAAVAGIRRAERDLEWSALAERGLSGLAVREEFALLSALGRSGREWRPKGFLGATVEGFEALEIAEGLPPDSPEAQREYRRAAERLRWASISPEAPPIAARSVEIASIGAAIESGEAVAAIERLDAIPPDDAAGDASRIAWLRLVALDRLAREGDEDASRRWRESARGFLAAHPDDPRSPMLAVRVGADDAPPQALGALARSGDPAVRQGARAALARRLPAAGDELRRAIAAEIVEGGPTSLELGGSPSDDARREAFEVAEASLLLGSEGLVRARRLLELLDPQRIPLGTEERARWWRDRAEVALLAGDAAGAADGWRRAVEIAGASWGAEARREWLRRLALAWRDEARREELAPLVLDESVAHLAALADGSTDVAPSARLAVESAAILWRLDPSEALATRWLGAAARLASAAPSDAAALESLALAAAAADEWERSLEAARRLLAGVPRGSDAWRRAKVMQVEALMAIDPAQARAVLDQHRVLDPTWEEGETGERLTRLDEMLPGGRR
ncbi:MAG: hypothetical protein FJ257_10105 [Phycisphaerae bacterium]|nr:hypothetical protein [Phycisphaerae bacterium]